jgi:glycosyltransferase involved in cell wall biosynthesis
MLLRAFIGKAVYISLRSSTPGSICPFSPICYTYCMISVVIPVKDSLDTLKTTLQSIVYAPTLREIIIVDDCSDNDTQNFIDGLRLDPGMNIRLTRTRNPVHSWTNHSWNVGVHLASQPYIAVVNSDIEVTSRWDVYLTPKLKYYTIVCPHEQVNGKIIKLDPLLHKVDPNMIKGAFYMFKIEDRDKLFPIPTQLTHWYGDRLISDRANELRGVGWSNDVIITHKASSSGRLIPKKEYDAVIHQDLYNYEKLTGKREELIRAELRLS